MKNSQYWLRSKIVLDNVGIVSLAYVSGKIATKAVKH